MKKGIVITLILMLVLAVSLMAQAPDSFVYQGRLTTPAGTPITATTAVTFRLYSDLTAGSLLHSWTNVSVTPDNNGVFTAELTTLDRADFSAGNKLYMQIEIGDQTLTPRQLLTSVPYAYSALYANSATTATTATTAVALTGAQTVAGNKTFTGEFVIGDSTFRASPSTTGGRIAIGSPSFSSNVLSYINRDFNTSTVQFAYYAIIDNATSASMYGIATNAYGVSTSARYGGYFNAANSGAVDEGTNYGVYGTAGNGATSYGVYGTATGATTNYAGYFSGNVTVTGTLAKAAGSFKIDHPLDPENKYLSHSFVESPDMMNVYNGNVILDGNGEALVELPDYFEVLNRDFRYQLTCIGGYAPVYIAEEISGNSFRIAGGTAGIKVSWQVTGIRQDPFAEANRIKVEEDKLISERGLYLNPEAYGFGHEKFINYESEKAAEKRPEVENVEPNGQ